MTQYIDKDALVAEIEKKLGDILACRKDAPTPEEKIALTNMFRLCKEILAFIDTFEVKEMQETTASDRGMAEEIIINLKRVEKDYRIDLTREI